MTYGSLFTGAGGFDIGFDRAGLCCLWQCEIDKTARSVLARHWPDVPKHEDVRAVGGHNLATVDVVVGGFPCQDLSVAGKRAGIQGGKRSGLWWEMLRVVTELRPLMVVWENVPGLLSSDGGRDHWRVCSSLAECGYFGAWRVLDAQHFGVPQRRRRVFGVFARGGAGVGIAAAVLALADGVPGHSAKGREAGAGVAFSLTASVGRNSGGTRVGNGWNTNYAVANSLTAANGHHGYGSPRGDGGDNQVVAPDVATFTELGEGHVTYQPTDVATSLRINTGGGSQAANLVAFGGGSRAERDVSTSLSARGERQDFDTDTFVAFAQNQRGEVRNLRDTLPAVQQPATNQTPIVAFTNRGAADVGGRTETLRAASHGAIPMASDSVNRVRRLMPVECERLMGWPETDENVVIQVCNTTNEYERQSSRVHAANPCLSGPSAAGSAANDERPASARSAATDSWPNNPLTGKPVALVADFNSEGSGLVLRNPSGLLSPVVSVGPPSWSGPLGRLAGSVHLGVLISTTAARATPAGAEESLRNRMRSSRLRSGSSIVVLSGPEIAGRASDVGRCISEATGLLKSTTSPHGDTTLTFDSILQTLCSSVVHATSGFIPETTRAASSFDLCVRWRTEWTRYREDGSEIADGPRYRMCGNGVVGTVAEWLARRLMEAAS